MITVENAKVSDFLAIAELDRNAWSENRNSGFIPDGEHIWRIWVEHALTVVAKDDKTPVGFGLAVPTLDEKMFYIHKVLFSKEYRGKGIGTKVVNNMVTYFDANSITAILSTDPINYAMQKVVENCGFDERFFEKGYYRPEEDRWIYKRYPK